MHHGTKKLFLGLVIVIFITGLLFVFQFKKSSAITTKNTPEPLLSPYAINIPISSSDPMLGNPGAPLTLVAFLDLGDKESRDVYAMLVDFVQKHPEDARLIWKDLPKESIIFGNNNVAHQAAWCAHDQKRFWPFVNEIMSGRDRNTEQELREAAVATKLDVEKWWTCTLEPATVSRVAGAAPLARELGGREAPLLFINNKRLNVQADIDLPQMLSSFIAK
ncbi:MAG TPA: thioredoxin domain-containing protein [Patescibacteria group bacterium]|nr:thioredoxin domain-containing protein [Patescibacteria group bacterium]